MKIEIIIGSKSSRLMGREYSTIKKIVVENPTAQKILTAVKPWHKKVAFSSPFVGIKRPEEFVKNNPSLGDYYFRGGIDFDIVDARNFILEIERW